MSARATHTSSRNVLIETAWLFKCRSWQGEELNSTHQSRALKLNGRGHHWSHSRQESLRCCFSHIQPSSRVQVRLQQNKAIKTLKKTFFFRWFLISGLCSDKSMSSTHAHSTSNQRYDSREADEQIVLPYLITRALWLWPTEQYGIGKSKWNLFVNKASQL